MAGGNANVLGTRMEIAAHAGGLGREESELHWLPVSEDELEHTFECLVVWTLVLT